MSFIARNERLLIRVWLGLWTAALSGFAVFGIALQGAEQLIDRSDQRLGERTARGRELSAAQDWAAAETYLAQLDREHPARHVLYARDREREEILTLLGRARLALGKKRGALDTFETLVAFDPLNWKNHDELRRAQAALAEPELAAESAEKLLALHGTHWPSVAMLVAHFAELGHCDEAVTVFERYLDTYRLAPLELSFSGASNTDRVFGVEVPADGRAREVSLPVDLLPNWSGQVTLATAGYSIEVAELVLAPPVLAGRSALRTAETRTLAQPAPIEAAGGLVAGARFLASASDSRIVFEIAAPGPGADRLRLSVRVFKHTTPEIWKRVEQCLTNLVDPARSAGLEPRVALGGCLAGGTLFP